MSSLPTLRAAALGLLAVSLAPAPASEDGPPAPATAPRYEVRDLEGWQVRVHPDLLGAEAELGSRALELLRHHLYAVRRALPAAAVKRLRAVPIWLELDEPAWPCAVFHPSRDWLLEHGHRGELAGSVQISNARNFLSWSRDQPSMVLHELAHAWHHLVLGTDEPRVRAAYEAAVAGGAYDSVLRIGGRRERAYALNNVEEYFAEGSEALFGTNDFYPFVRAELREHDPAGWEALRAVWGVGGGEPEEGAEAGGAEGESER